MNRLAYYIIAILAVALVAHSVLFVTDQRKYAIVSSLGEFKEMVDQPGLHAKLPWPFQDVVFLERRLQMSEMPEPRHFHTAEKKDVLAGAFVKWRIRDPKLYFVSFRGGDAAAENRLMQTLNTALDGEIARHTFKQMLFEQRSEIVDAVKKTMADDAGKTGIDVIDVRLSYVGYPEDLNDSIFKRMKSEQVRAAAESRSRGAAESEKIKADADKQRTLILAEADREAERIRGEGDAKASQIYAQAFGQDPDFYRFYRSLDAYRASFRSKSDVLVLDPNSEFLKYFKSPGGSGARK